MDLQNFVGELDDRGLLARVRRRVDPRFELAAVARALRGRPVLFETVAESSLPVVSNVYASRELVALGLGVERNGLLPALAEAVEHPREPSLVEANDYQEQEPDLGWLPILTSYPQDGGPYVASGVAVALDPEHGINASYHRAMVVGPRELAVRIVERHLHAYMGKGLREFAYCIGLPTSVSVAAALSVELGKSELAIAHALRPIELVELAGHQVPRAEVVLICELTGEEADEGPFLDLTGTFDIVRRQPVVRVRRAFVRHGALFHVLLPGDFEHKVLMGMPREPTIFREVSRVCECLDVRLTPGGCSWLHGAVRIRSRRPDDGRRAIEAAFRGHPSMKHVFVVDEDVDIDDPAALEWALATRFQGHRDLVMVPGQRSSSLDPSSELATGTTTKVGFDCTAPADRPAQGFRRPEPPLAIDLDDYL